MLALAKPRGQYIRWKGGAWRAPASFRPAVPKQRISMPLVHLHSLWVGPRLNYLERLCLASAKAMGHDFTLWSYEPGALAGVPAGTDLRRSEEHTSELQSLMRISYAVFCLKKKKTT